MIIGSERSDGWRPAEKGPVLCILRQASDRDSGIRVVGITKGRTVYSSLRTVLYHVHTVVLCSQLPVHGRVAVEMR